MNPPSEAIVPISANMVAVAPPGNVDAAANTIANMRLAVDIPRDIAPPSRIV